MSEPIHNGVGAVSNITQLLLNLAILSMMAVSGLLWGLKLDERTMQNVTDISEIKSELKHGILPITEERLKSHDRRLDDLEERLRRQERKDGQ